MRTTAGELKALPRGCEEASSLSAERYIPCNAPATRLIRNRDGVYRMCDACANHNVRNRGATDEGPFKP